MWELLVSILLVAGGALTAIAGLGLARMPDLLIRMHAATKAGTLGVGLVAAAAAMFFAESAVVARGIAIIVVLLVTAPVAAHLIARAAWRGGIDLHPTTRIERIDAPKSGSGGPL